MEIVENILGSLTKSFGPIILQAIDYIYEYKLIIFIISLLFLIFFRLAMSNILYLKENRNDKSFWVIWGVIAAFQIISFFIQIHWLWLVIQVLIWCICLGYLYIFDGKRQAITTIYQGGVVFEDTSDRHDGNRGDSEAKQARKDREQRVKRTWCKDRVSWKYGVPIFTMKFTFKLSPTIQVDQTSKVIKNLNDFYSFYDWTGARNNDKYSLTASAKSNKINSVNFDKELSDALPWYIVPCGVIDTSTKQTQKETPFVWEMHDPKTEGKSFEELKKTKILGKAPMGFIIGATGGGKSVLLNTIIAHWINKGKQERQTELYLADAKQMEFKAYEGLEEIAGVAVTLEDAVELLREFDEEMTKRNNMMAAEGTNKLPLDGKFKLRKHVNINGQVIPKKEVLEVKLEDGTIKKMRAIDLVGRTDISEINLKADEVEDEDDEDDDLW